MSRIPVLVCVVAAGIALAAAGPASQRRSPGAAFLGPFGTGAEEVWLVLPRSLPRSIAVFLHGWKVAPPSPSYPWLGQFRPWLEHLAARGSAVIFPAYQTGEDGQGSDRVESLRRGLAVGFERLHTFRRLPVVVAGYSYGASLAFSFAANARRWRLPVPRAVDAVFPAGPISGSPLPELDRSVQVLIQVGDRDTVAGRSGADAFWSWLGRRHGGRQRLVVVRSRQGLIADHAAPKLATLPARDAFWLPLDALIARARA